MSDEGRKTNERPLWRDPKRLWREHRRETIAGIVAAAALLIGGAVFAYEQLKRPADIHNESVPFNPRQSAPKPKPKAKHVNWPMFGLNRARTRYLAVRGVKPPFRKLWRYKGRPLLEFPPIFVGGRLYFGNNSGFAFSLDADTGRILWKRRIGRLNASSPTYARGRLYIVNLVPGHIVKMHARTGRVIWKRNLPGRAESSPLVVGRTVYFGCECGELFAMSTVNGNVRWSTSLGGPVKSAPAYQRGTLYVGDYGGYMNAVDARTGELEWQSGSLGPGFGASGAFYSTPAVAFGRVYAGNNDARVYSFDRRDGTVAWSYSTGGYAYSGPTVARTKHSPPTVYIGSFDGNIYALDARDGGVRWSRSTGGQVIGSLSAIGEIVYVAEFSNESTQGYRMRSGRKVFEYPYGTYTPVISDGRRIYLTGYSSITALQPYRYRARVAGGFEAPPGKPRPTWARAGQVANRRRVAQRRQAARRRQAAKRRRAARRAARTRGNGRP